MLLRDERVFWQVLVQVCRAGGMSELVCTRIMRAANGETEVRVRGVDIKRAGDKTLAIL